VKTRLELQASDRQMSRYVRIGSGTPEIKGFRAENGGLPIKELCNKQSEHKGTIVEVWA
jgi:hypothetical protein